MPWLRCPTCGATDLDLEAAGEDGGDVLEGAIRCAACGASYGVEGGIPVLLTAETRELVDRRLASADPRGFHDYTTERTPAVARLVRRVAESAEFVLDLGSGRAPYLDLLRGDVICVDLFPPFLHDLRGAGVNGVRIHPVCASVTELPFREGVADLVLASQVVVHLPPELASEAIARWPSFARRWCLVDTPNGHEGSAIGWFSRRRFRLGPLWDAYDAIAWRVPSIGGTLVAVAEGRGRAGG
jgi:uncharacterized protein YbaR (Trm112 family)